MFCYLFDNNIRDLADIIMLIANKYVGYSIEDLIRHINEEVFGKKRLTNGYKTVYLKVFKELECRGKIQLAGEIIASVD